MVRTTEIPDRPGQCPYPTAAEPDPADRDGDHSFERPGRASQEHGLARVDLLWRRARDPRLDTSPTVGAFTRALSLNPAGVDALDGEDQPARENIT